MRFDPPGDDETTRRVDRLLRLVAERPARLEGDDALSVDGHVQLLLAGRRDDRPVANQEIMRHQGRVRFYGASVRQRDSDSPARVRLGPERAQSARPLVSDPRFGRVLAERATSSPCRTWLDSASETARATWRRSSASLGPTRRARARRASRGA